MTIMDFLNRSGGPNGVISVGSGGGGYSTSYDIAHGDLSVTNKFPSFSPGKRDPQELWDEIKDDVMSIVTAKDNLPEQYPAIKLYQGGKDVHSGIGHIKTGVDLLMLPVPTPLDDISGVGYCIYGILEATGGLVKSIIAVDRLE